MAYMQFYNHLGHTPDEGKRVFDTGPAGGSGVSSHACYGSMPAVNRGYSTVSIGAVLPIITEEMLLVFAVSLVQYFPAAKLRVLSSKEEDKGSKWFRGEFDFSGCHLLYSLILNDEWLELYGGIEEARKARLMYHTFLRCPQENAGVFLCAWRQYKEEGEKRSLLTYILENHRMYQSRRKKYLNAEEEARISGFRANYSPGSGHGFCEAGTATSTFIPYSVDQMLATAIYGQSNMNTTFTQCAGMLVGK